MKSKNDSLTIRSASADKEDKNNNFYDNEETFHLIGSEIEIVGEIANPGKVDFANLPKRSVIVKETLLNDDGTNRFVGAYRYDGYSLFDILKDRVLKKKNAEEFKPIIDLYVEIENRNGEKVVLSWGEIYYPNFLNNILIATDVMRIVPSKTKDLWPLPTERRLIVAQDLITERNISDPVRITIKSYDRNFPVNREIKPLYSAEISSFINNNGIGVVKEEFNNQQKETLHTVFYGKGRGIHSTQPFTGYYLKDLFLKQWPFTKGNLRTGLIVIVGLDGYRSVYSYSEVMNRNDQAEVLLVPSKPQEEGGAYRIFPSCDFFSDRAVKAVSEIHFTTGEMVK